jgi:hypothetical protein
MGRDGDLSIYLLSKSSRNIEENWRHDSSGKVSSLQEPKPWVQTLVPSKRKKEKRKKLRKNLSYKYLPQRSRVFNYTTESNICKILSWHICTFSKIYWPKLRSDWFIQFWKSSLKHSRPALNTKCFSVSHPFSHHPHLHVDWHSNEYKQSHVHMFVYIFFLPCNAHPLLLVID